jgi:plastocyanin
MSLLRLTLVVTLVAACGGGGYGSGPNGSGPPTTATVRTPTLAFTPSAVTLARDGTVTWTFGATSHSVIFDDAGAPSNIAACLNCSNARLFPTAGAWAYHCGIHASMTGTITVQ